MAGKRDVRNFAIGCIRDGQLQFSATSLPRSGSCVGVDLRVCVCLCAIDITMSMSIIVACPVYETYTHALEMQQNALVNTVRELQYRENPCPTRRLTLVFRHQTTREISFVRFITFYFLLLLYLKNIFIYSSDVIKIEFLIILSRVLVLLDDSFAQRNGQGLILASKLYRKNSVRKRRI